MTFSRRHFLKAAGAGGPGAVALTAVGASVAGVVGLEETAAAQTPASPLAIPAPVTKETGTFNVNGRTHRVEYEVRTTLWEVLTVKLPYVGANRACNRATCGACSVLVDGVPTYSCHTLAAEATGKRIFTVEGLGDEKNMHPLQQVGYRYMAADCGYCTAGWETTAKALLDTNTHPTADDVKAALAGHICRCNAYPNIIRTVVDTAKVLRGEAEIV
jgi:aerobic-type carbon monoxide dehydrogenase small subunit (CoxS/CutS family)